LPTWQRCRFVRRFQSPDENKGFFNGDFPHEFKGFFEILNQDSGEW
jgi:hypothetical protein